MLSKSFRESCFQGENEKMEQTIQQTVLALGAGGGR